LGNNLRELWQLSGNFAATVRWLMAAQWVDGCARCHVVQCAGDVTVTIVTGMLVAESCRG